MTTPSAVQIVEVSPRDGLQSDPTILATGQKVELISMLARTGIQRIETVSLVNPQRVPQMAGAHDVMAALRANSELEARGSSYIGLVLNDRGFDRAIDVDVDEINVAVMATDSFAHANQNSTTDALIEVAANVAERAQHERQSVSVTVSASFGCPFDGPVSTGMLADVLEPLAALPIAELALADSIGVATPRDVAERVQLAKDIIGDRDVSLRCHFHNTRNTAVANCYAAWQVGVSVFDTSLGGIGGCPFAPNATGNVATEDVVNMFENMGVTTGIASKEFRSMVPWVENILGHGVPGLTTKAPVYPPVSSPG